MSTFSDNYDCVYDKNGKLYVYNKFDNSRVSKNDYDSELTDQIGRSRSFDNLSAAGCHPSKKFQLRLNRENVSLENFVDRVDFVEQMMNYNDDIERITGLVEQKKEAQQELREVIQRYKQQLQQEDQAYLRSLSDDIDLSIRHHRLATLLKLEDDLTAELVSLQMKLADLQQLPLEMEKRLRLALHLATPADKQKVINTFNATIEFPNGPLTLASDVENEHVIQMLTDLDSMLHRLYQNYKDIRGLGFMASQQVKQDKLLNLLFDIERIVSIHSYLQDDNKEFLREVMNEIGSIMCKGNQFQLNPTQQKRYTDVLTHVANEEKQLEQKSQQAGNTPEQKQTFEDKVAIAKMIPNQLCHLLTGITTRMKQQKFTTMQIREVVNNVVDLVHATETLKV
jgi:hypothetical protein